MAVTKVTMVLGLPIIKHIQLPGPQYTLHVQFLQLRLVNDLVTDVETGLYSMAHWQMKQLGLLISDKKSLGGYLRVSLK